MATRGSESTTAINGNGGDHDHGDVTLDIFGVTLLLTKAKKIVLADGRKPRKSVSDPGAIIPGHFPFLAIESGRYVAYRGDRREAIKPVMSFAYDLDGAGVKTPLDAFVLDGHVVSFSEVEPHSGDINPRNIPQMNTLVERLELCPAVAAGTSRQVVATIDLTNARLAQGMDHGAHSDHRLRFGATVSNAPEKLIAKFERTHGKPRIELKRRESDLRRDGQDTFTIELDRDDPPPRVMIGNVPAEEVMDLNFLPDGKEIPLTHIELLYDLYHGAPAALPVPRCTDHVKGSAAGAHAHTAGGHCGPPMQEGEGG
jgi:hypothetical protein